MTTDFRHKRSLMLINKAIKELSLDLGGLTVVTEIGSNNYLYTPFIAALAGAEKVYAWAKDSVYGSATDILEQYEIFAATIPGISEKIVIRANEKNYNDIREANIITNSGALRPLNESLLKYAHKKCVIPLMYEAWEIRVQDIDIDYCKKAGLRVAGTNESNSLINIFEYGGPLAIKLAQEAGYEVYKNNILVWSDDEFGKVASKAFNDMGASDVIHTNEISVFYEYLNKLDFIYICDYDEKRNYFGEDGIFDLSIIKQINPTLGIIHLYGDVDTSLLSENHINVYPVKKGVKMVMSETLAYIGLTPIIYLQVAGFKVAMEVIDNKLSDLSQPLF